MCYSRGLIIFAPSKYNQNVADSQPALSSVSGEQGLSCNGSSNLLICSEESRIMMKSHQASKVGRYHGVQMNHVGYYEKLCVIIAYKKREEARRKYRDLLNMNRYYRVSPFARERLHH
jgi:hypothetical protein